VNDKAFATVYIKLLSINFNPNVLTRQLQFACFYVVYKTSDVAFTRVKRVTLLKQ